MALLSCDGVTLGYDGKVVVSKLGFEVNKGDYLCIVGENGSGKSTLVKSILGLHGVMSGSIRFGDGIRKGEIGYLPQRTDVGKDFPASVWEVVMSGTLSNEGFSHFYNARQKQRATAALKRLGIEELSKKCYRELSGGQQQRTLLARALCATSRLILLDEPAASLDPRVTAELYEIIEDLNKNDGVSVIMVSHDLSAAKKYATHVLHVGDKVFFGTREQYFSGCGEFSSFAQKEGESL